MEQLGQLRDRFLIFAFCILLGCKEEPMLVYNAKTLALKTQRGVTLNQGIPFSGIVIKQFPESQDTLSIQKYRHGKADGTWKRFYRSGKTQEIRYYENGKKIRAHKYYYPSGKLKFHYQLENDVYHGFKKEWNPQGLIISHKNYENGQEEGKQQRWYENGKVKSNYIIKNGRRYGLLGTKNCINVKDSLF